ncbi:MAG: hypothetical protein ACK448_08065 [Bacteroidota bacterium]|jgi:hypothetical protein
MNLLGEPVVLIGIAAIFLGALFYVRNLTEKALALLTAEEKGLWIEGMRESRKKLFYAVMVLVGVYILVVVLGGRTAWYAAWESIIFITYFGFLVFVMLWSHSKSMQFLVENGFSAEAISLMRKSFWIKVFAYLFPIGLMAYSSGVFR